MTRVHRRYRKLPFGAERFLAVFEGFEGGFAIAASVIAGLSFAGLDRKVLLFTAIISLIVNGFNAASVKYSSQHYLDELDGRETLHPFRRYFLPSFLEFIAYFSISFISIIPLLLVSDISLAIGYSIALTLVFLFLAGYWRAHLLGMPKWRDAVETALLGSGIILVGIVSGWLLHSFV